jgi:hypothetical protein
MCRARPHGALLLALVATVPAIAASAVGATPAPTKPAVVAPDSSRAPPTDDVVLHYTQPLVRARLRLPNSLKDYRIEAITPVQDDPGRFEVRVRFKAETPFGATTEHEARFSMRQAAVPGLWIVTAP